MANFLKNEVLEKMASNMKQSRGTCQRRLKIMDHFKKLKNKLLKKMYFEHFFLHSEQRNM
jgi:hypothetical protein